MEELIENFNEISNVYADRLKMTFSGMICKSDKPELNTRIDMLNADLKSLAMNRA